MGAREVPLPHWPSTFHRAGGAPAVQMRAEVRQDAAPGHGGHRRPCCTDATAMAVRPVPITDNHVPEADRGAFRPSRPDMASENGSENRMQLSLHTSAFSWEKFFRSVGGCCRTLQHILHRTTALFREYVHYRLNWTKKCVY